MGQGYVLGHVLNVGAVRSETPVGTHLLVDDPVELGEAPLLADVDLHKKQN